MTSVDQAITEPHAEAGYGEVADLFNRSLKKLGAGGGAFAAYVDGRKVVDLWGGHSAPGRPWAADTRSILMSSTKGLSTMCVQLLVDRGLIDVEAPVAKYWPEFAQAGKQDILVRHVLTHTAGVFGWPTASQVMKWDGTGWDQYDAIAAGLAAAPAEWAPGERFGYHAISYGWLTGELVRRVSGDTIGTFFRREIAEPLGVDASIGTSPADQERLATLIASATEGIPFVLRPLVSRAMKLMRDPTTLSGKAFLGDGTSSIMEVAGPLFASPAFLAAELPGGNGSATARGLARVYACIARDGELDGVRIWSAENVARFSKIAISMPDALMLEAAPAFLRKKMSFPIERTLGYLVNPRNPGAAARFGPAPHAFGHDGAGGQVAFADREAKISVGFVRNAMTASTAPSVQLINAVYRCAGG